MTDLRNDEQYRNMIKRIKGSCLLALPQSAAKILELSRNPENGPPEFAKAIASDVGLTSQILRFVNSSYFGFRNKVTTIRAALSLVYGRTIKNFILWNAVFALLPNPKCGPFMLKTLCQDSVRRGVFAKVFAEYFPELDSEELFICGLFQDIALPILAQNWPEEYESILNRRQNEYRRISDLEQEIFGWNHALAGAYLVEEWGFDEEIAEVVTDHIQPSFDIDPNHCSTAELRRIIVSLSALLPSIVDETWDEADRFFSAYFRFHLPGIPKPDELFIRIEENVADLLKLSKLGSSKNLLPEFHKKWLETLE